MREIKFRAVSCISGEWVYGNLVNDYVVPFDYFELDGHHLRCDSDYPVFTEEETIGQYTGLKDIDGVEIYEGDLVDCLGHVSEVKWNEKYCLFEIEILSTGNMESQELLGNHIENLKVTGNIHQNKELLEEEV